MSKWAESCSQASMQTKTFSGQAFSGLFNSIIELHLKRKKKKLKPTEKENTSPGKTISSHISSDLQRRKEAEPSSSRPSSAPDSHPLLFCYFNFTTSKWGKNRLIVSMSLDWDQRRTKQFQKLKQPQLWREDDDGFTNSSWDSSQSWESWGSTVLPGWKETIFLHSFFLHMFILAYCNSRQLYSVCNRGQINIFKT